MSYKLNIDVIAAVKHYIKESWIILQRSHHNLLRATIDPKVPQNEGRVVYISAKENLANVKLQLENTLAIEDFQQLSIKKLPEKNSAIKQHGLLYLPRPYIVPGGRFNEMYGWDSFFILLGLLHDEQISLAKDMVENAAYQVNYYGKILNANRTYQLDRSQPPLLSQMILAVYYKIQDKDWLASQLVAMQKFYEFWMTPPHLINGLGLSRYYAASNQPAPEVIYSELDQFGYDHYQRVKEYYRTHKIHAYTLRRFYSRETEELSAAFYQADRTAREAGFDPSSKYGPFGAATTSYAPVCLNTLLYQMEEDFAVIYRILGETTLSEEWLSRAKKRARLINQHCWDHDLGHYFDYHVKKQRTRPYIFATTFYPLWAGIASKEQAQRVVQNLPALEAPGGLLTSAYVTGNQWDAPFGWAPLHYFAVKGLMRYGYNKAAKRLAYKFIKVIHQEFLRSGVIYEKYDISKLSAKVQNTLQFGYVTNEVGFGWTNGVYLELLSYFTNS